MPINRTTKRAAKKATGAEPEYNDFFEAMKTGETVKAEDVKADPDMAAQLAALMQRVDTLTADNAAFRAQALRPQAPVVVQQQAPVQQQTASDMPDPILEVDKYAKWIEQRIDALASQKIADLQKAQEAKSQQDGAYNDLWNNFLAIDGNDIWSDKSEQVQVAAIKVGKKAQARGLDPNDYMLKNTEAFYKDLSETLHKDFPQQEEEEDDGDDEGEDVDRTGGLMGGQVAPTAKPKAGSAGAPDLVADLVAIQRKGGWY